MRSAKSPEAKAETALAWAEGWRREQAELVRMLDGAIDTMDRAALRSAAGQLHEITSKRFDGLAGAVRRLSENAIETDDD